MRDPNSELVRVSAAGNEPIELADAKLWLRVDTTDDDTLIGSLILGARRYAERFCRRSFLVGEQWKLSLDHFPLAVAGNLGYWNEPLSALWNTPEMYLLGRSRDLAITLDEGPVSQINAVTYTDPTGAPQTLAATGYTLVPDGDANTLVYPGYQDGWPATRNYPQSVQILYTTGVAPEPDVYMAMMQAIAFWYRNRESTAQLPAGVEQLLWPSRLLEF